MKGKGKKKIIVGDSTASGEYNPDAAAVSKEPVPQAATQEETPH